MSPLPFASAAVLGLLLASPSPANSKPAAAPAAAVAGSEIPEGFALASDGTTLIHVASGLRFPAKYQGFTRLNEKSFDPTGEYVAIGYDRPLGNGAGKDGDKLVVRMAIVHIDKMSAHDHYTIMRQRAMSHFAAVSVISEGPAVIRTNRKLDAYRGIFSGYQGAQPWRFSLTTADYGYWSGRLTAAYPQRDAAEAEKSLDILLAAIRRQEPHAPKP